MIQNMSMSACYLSITRYLDLAGLWLGFVLLRFLIGWEFLDSGLEKYHGTNWFMQIQDRFLFPFNIISADISWLMATWFEIIGGISLMLGAGTRFFSITLIILTIVATAAVHWPAGWETLSELAMGYAITNNGFGNFKLPALFIAMLLPLLFMGAGKLSVDALVNNLLTKRSSNNVRCNIAN